MKTRSRIPNEKTRVCRPDLGVTMDDLSHGATFNYDWSYLQSLGYLKERDFLKSVYFTRKLQRNIPSGFALWPLSSESITTGSLKTHGMRNCAHVSQRAVQYPLGYLRTGTPSNMVDGASYYRAGTNTGYWKDALSAALYAANDGDQQFNDRAYWSMRPRFQADVSLINSIFELKDFVDVAVLLGDIVFRPSSVVRNIIKQYTKIAKKGKLSYKQVIAGSLPAAHMVSGAVASGVLTANLAVSPTINDVISIHAAAQRSVYQLAHEFKTYGQIGSKTHFKEVDVVVNDVTANSTVFNNVFWSGRRITVENNVTAVWYYKTLWQKLEDLYPQWWGLKPGVGEVWNMLPMSFVLDYIFTLGKSLEYMDRDDNVDVQGVQWCRSSKSIATLGTYLRTSPHIRAVIVNDKQLEYTTQNNYLFVSGTRGKCYKRWIGMPTFGPALPRFKKPTGSQLENLAALARVLLF